jgi:hypothetical protein
MGRRLPSYDPDKDGEYSGSKRRIQVFKRIYQNYYHWQALRETGEVSDILAVDGEEIYIGDLMVGIDSLPNRQRQAFELICLRGYTESAATAILLPNSRWSTPVQQYSDDGLKKMIAAYDARQDGTWDPLAVRRKRRKKACKDTPEGQEFTAAPGQDCSLPSENEKGLESAPTDTGEESGV